MLYMIEYILKFDIYQILLDLDQILIIYELFVKLKVGEIYVVECKIYEDWVCD